MFTLTSYRLYRAFKNPVIHYKYEIDFLPVTHYTANCKTKRGNQATPKQFAHLPQDAISNISLPLPLTTSVLKQPELLDGRQSSHHVHPCVLQRAVSDPRAVRDSVAMSADSELTSVLIRRQEINDALNNGDEVRLKYRVVNVYTEFHEFTRKQIKQYESTFKRFNTSKDNYLNLSELKLMMETLGAPQTHLALKGMIAEVDEDGDGRLSFREFLLVYRKARAGELEADSGLAKLALLTEIDVDKVGVNGAKEFFEAKIEELNRKSKFENEIREEQEERKKLEEEKAIRREQFLKKAAMFKV